MKNENDIRNRIYQLSLLGETFSDADTMRAYIKAIEQLEWVLEDDIIDNIIKRPSVSIQDCEDRKCPLLDGIICRATNNDSCPEKLEDKNEK